MSRKALSIFVDVDIQAVTCPGVWLCPNGRVQLVVSMLGQQVRTQRTPPVFPLLIHEHFSFHKVFPSAGCLSELQSLLGMHDVEAILLQEAEGEPAVQLARFSCSVLHLLFPSPCSKGLLAGVDVDLLMEASADFPGILAPKIELSTRTTVEEVTDYYSSPEDYTEAYIINPKTLVSRVRSSGSPDHNSAEGNNREYRGICGKKHRSRRSSCVEVCRQRLCSNRRAASLPRRVGSPKGEGEKDFSDHCNMTCPCVTGHVDSRCSLCNRYKAVFRDSQVSLDPVNGTELTVKSRRCRCPDRRSCAFLRCKRCPRSLRHEVHAARDHHWESSPAAAAFRRSHGFGVASDSSPSQVATGAGTSLPTAAPPSVQDSLPGDFGPQSPAAALHARVERLLQPAADPDNIYKWIGNYGRSKTSPVRASRRHVSLLSSDESVQSHKSPLSPSHLLSRAKRDPNCRPPSKSAAFGRVLRTYPCSCTESPESKCPEGRESVSNLLNANSFSVDSKIFEVASDERFDSDGPNEKSEHGDRRMAFYSNLERYYRKLYMRAKARVARINAS